MHTDTYIFTHTALFAAQPQGSGSFLIESKQDTAAALDITFHITEEKYRYCLHLTAHIDRFNN